MFKRNSIFNENRDYCHLIYRFFADGNRLTYAALGIGLLVAILYFRIFFRNVDGFEDDVNKSERLPSERIPVINPNYDYIDSQWSGGKITFWIILSIGSGIAAYYQLPGWFPHVFKVP